MGHHLVQQAEALGLSWDIVSEIAVEVVEEPMGQHLHSYVGCPLLSSARVKGFGALAIRSASLAEAVATGCPRCMTAQMITAAPSMPVHPRGHAERLHLEALFHEAIQRRDTVVDALSSDDPLEVVDAAGWWMDAEDSLAELLAAALPSAPADLARHWARVDQTLLESRGEVALKLWQGESASYVAIDELADGSMPLVLVGMRTAHPSAGLRARMSPTSRRAQATIEVARWFSTPLAAPSTPGRWLPGLAGSPPPFSSANPARSVRVRALPYSLAMSAVAVAFDAMADDHPPCRFSDVGFCPLPPGADALGAAEIAEGLLIDAEFTVSDAVTAAAAMT